MPKLVLIRHGQSAWNLENRFTGWWDVDLTEQGVRKPGTRAQLMKEKGLDFDLSFTSFQSRAIKTLEPRARIDGAGCGCPTEKSWKLNERHYGGLTGLNKAETAALHGDEQVEDLAPQLRRAAAAPRRGFALGPRQGRTLSRRGRSRRPRA